MHGAAALLQQADDVLVLDLLMHLELLEGGTQRLEKRAEITVVGEVGFRQLGGRENTTTQSFRDKVECHNCNFLHPGGKNDMGSLNKVSGISY